MDWQDPLSFYQLMAWPPFLLYIVSYQILNPRKTIMLWIPASLFMAVHLYGMGSISALLIVLGSIFRDCAAVFGSRRILLYTTVTYVIYAWVMIFLFGVTIQDYLVGVGTVCLSIATFFRDRFWYHRFFSIGNQTFWLVAFIFMGSYGGIVQNLFIMSSNVMGMIRRFRQKD